MKIVKVFTLFLLLVPVLLPAQKKPKKPSVPAVFDHARFVYVEAIDGDEFKPGLLPADREAIADVRDALQAWGRYTFTTERDKADLVFVVRKGQLIAEVGGISHQSRSGGPGTGASNSGNPGMDGPGAQDSQFPGQQNPRGAGTGLNVGGEAGTDQDLLEVCTLNQYGKLSNPLWMGTLENGLNPPRLMLFSQFKDEVDKSYPPVAPTPPAPPAPVSSTAPSKP